MIQGQVKEEWLAGNRFKIRRKGNDVWLAGEKARIVAIIVQSLQKRLKKKASADFIEKASLD